MSKINRVLQSEVLEEIAKARGKSVAQVSSLFFFSVCLDQNLSFVFDFWS
jgi:hypothetical protein